METKKCKTCKKELPLSLFGMNSRMVDGHHYNCKECANLKSRQWRKIRTAKVSDIGADVVVDTIIPPAYQSEVDQLKEVSSKALIYTLRSRGYKGELELTLKVVI